jgi:urate oxidase
MSSPIALKESRYGKSRVRLVKVERHGARHDLKDISVDIRLTGTFDASYLEGDNRLVLPTDTMKNTVYALARQAPLGEIEEYGLRLADHFLERNDQVSRARIEISENLWRRIECAGEPHDHAFQLSGPEQRTAVIDRDRTRTSIEAGIAGLVVMKTGRSAFEGFLKDEYTTLKDAADRVFGTAVKAEWSYDGAQQHFGELWNGVRATLLEIFANHDSRAVQHTLSAMGEAVLQRFDPIREIRLSMPNRHCLLVDLTPFHMDNPNEVFVPTEEPYGVIEATLTRSGS